MKIANCKSQIDAPRLKTPTLLAFAFPILVVATRPAAAAEPLESQPYRVRIEISFGPSTEFDGNFRQRMLDEVAHAVERDVGEFWQCEVAEHRGRLFSGLAALERL